MIIHVEDDNATTNYTEEDFLMLWGYCGENMDKLMGILRFINAIGHPDESND